MNPLDLIGWRTTGLLNRLSDRRWEQKLGIDTAGVKDVHQPDANRYATFAYASIMKILRRAELRPDDVFVDIGCGKGRVVCSAATLRLKEVIGVDIDRELCDIARANARRLKNRQSPVRIENLPAQQFDYSPCTVFFLFNSFGADTLAQVLASIESTLQDRPRPFRFIYVNPFHEHLLKASPRFEEYDRWHRRPWSGLKFDVSFWRNAGRG